MYYFIQYSNYFRGRLQQLNFDEDCNLVTMIWRFFQVLFQNDGSVVISKTNVKRD